MRGLTPDRDGSGFSAENGIGCVGCLRCVVRSVLREGRGGGVRGVERGVMRGVEGGGVRGGEEGVGGRGRLSALT